MITEASLHRRRNAQRLMHLAEVVVGEVQRNVVCVHFKLLAEGVRQSREAAHVHPHREVLAFNVGR